MPYLFDIVLMIVVVGAAVVIGFWWSLLLVVANNDRGLIETGLAAVGLLAAYRWWKNRDSRQDIDDLKRP